MKMGDGDHSICQCFVITSVVVCTAVALLVLVSSTVRFYVKAFLYLLTIINAGTVGAILSLPHGRTTNNHFRMFKVFQWTCQFLHLRFIIRNKENLVSDKAFIIIANHQSAIDVLGMSYCWPQNCSVMLKSSLKYLPGFNLCAYMCKAIWVNRFSKEKAHKAVDTTLDVILKDHRKVWIYPEGTRNPGKEMLPFKKGAFILAMETKVPVVCCVFSSHKFFYDAALKKFDSGECIADIMTPIDSTKFGSVAELSDYCRNSMMAKFDELNKEMREKLSSKDK